ncbi:MAG TPA: YceI family protein [Cyclobacteriaceae bacterium]
MIQNIKTSKVLLFTLLFVISAIAIANAQDTFSLKSSTASVQGTSSLHDWESQITKVECTGSFQAKSNRLQSMKNVKVTIAVKGIKSKEGKVMDNKTYDAFRSKANPFITYSFVNAQIKTGKQDSVNITTKGNLTMAGTSRPIELNAKGKMLTNGDLQFSFSRKLKMTDFNMKPPKAVLGTIKVGDEITLNFNMVLTHIL